MHEIFRMKTRPAQAEGIIPRHEGPGGKTKLPPQMRCAAHSLNLVAGDLEKKMESGNPNDLPGYKKAAKGAFGRAHQIWRKQGKKIFSLFYVVNIVFW